MGYAPTMLLATEGRFGNHFSGSAVVSVTPGIPADQSVLSLSRRGIVAKTGEAKRATEGTTV
jgi:hypothetical protein